MPPVTFPDYQANAANVVQGPGRAFVAPYVPAGGDAATADIVPVGLFSKDGTEFDHKLTIADIESDQSAYAVDAFTHKQELDVKLTLQEITPANWNMGWGQPPSALAGPPATMGLGDFFNIIASSGIPTLRPVFRQWLFQFPSAGHDNSTSPVAAFGYIQLYKATVVAHGPFKIGKDHQGTIQITVRAYADFSIASPTNRVGFLYLP